MVETPVRAVWFAFDGSILKRVFGEELVDGSDLAHPCIVHILHQARLGVSQRRLARLSIQNLLFSHYFFGPLAMLPLLDGLFSQMIQLLVVNYLEKTFL